MFSPSGIATPCIMQHTVPRAQPTHHPKRHLDQFSRFCMGPKCYAVQCVVNGEENCPQWDFVSPPEDRATAIGNMHKKFGKDRVCCLGDILVDRHTHRQTHSYTQTYSLQYFATAPTGGSNNTTNKHR